MLPVEQIDSVRLGQEARVYVQGSAEAIAAKVIYISPTVESTGQFNVDVELSNPAAGGANQARDQYRYRFRPGMRAQVELIGGK